MRSRVSRSLSRRRRPAPGLAVLTASILAVAGCQSDMTASTPSISTSTSSAASVTTGSVSSTPAVTASSAQVAPSAAPMSGDVVVLNPFACPSASDVTDALGVGLMLNQDLNIDPIDDCRYDYVAEDAVTPINVTVVIRKVAGLDVVPQLFDAQAPLSWPDLSPDAWGMEDVTSDRTEFRCTFRMPTVVAGPDLGTLSVEATGIPGMSVDGPFALMDKGAIDTVCAGLGRVAVLFAPYGPATAEQARAVLAARKR